MANEKFYDEEEQVRQDDEQFDEAEVPEEDYDGQEEAENPDDASELSRLLEFLEETLNAAPAVPLSGNKRMVSLQMCLDIVDDIRNCLPTEIRQAYEILNTRDRIIKDAKIAADNTVKAANARADSAIADATRRAQETVHEAEDRAEEIIKQAQDRARAMIDQSEITRIAHEEAAQICEDARADANDQRLDANRYAENLLGELERDVQATLDAVRRSINNIAGATKR